MARPAARRAAIGSLGLGDRRAWLLGVAIVVTALSAAPNGWPVWVHAANGVLAAMAMGLTVGTVTGRTLERLLKGRLLARGCSVSGRR